MIYLNNSATSYPKPESVITEMTRSLSTLPMGQFRSSDGFAGDIFTECKNNLGRLLNIKDTERIYFTSGSTEALNMLIRGVNLTADRFLTTAAEHNSVLRVLYNLDVASGNNPGITGGACELQGSVPVIDKTAEPCIVPCDEYGFIDIEEFEHIIKDNNFSGMDSEPKSEIRLESDNPTESGLKSLYSGSQNHKIKVCIVNHCSNVTGAVQDVKELCRIAHCYGALFFLDISQSAGVMNIDVDGWDVDGVAFTGHKGLLGPQGTGGFYIKRGINLKPLLYGGTGRDSSKIIYDNDYEYEVGTQNVCGICGLNAGIKEVLKLSVDNIEAKETALADYAAYRLSSIENVNVYREIKESESGEGAECNRRYGPVVSFNIQGMKASDTAYILQNSYEIITRAGLHCAPLCTPGGEDGTVRISPGIYNTESEIDELINAVKEISSLVWQDLQK